MKSQTTQSPLQSVGGKDLVKQFLLSKFPALALMRVSEDAVAVLVCFVSNAPLAPSKAELKATLNEAFPQVHFKIPSIIRKMA